MKMVDPKSVTKNTCDSQTSTKSLISGEAVYSGSLPVMSNTPLWTESSSSRNSRNGSGGGGSALSKVLVVCMCCGLGLLAVAFWLTLHNSMAVKILQQDVQLSLANSMAVRELESRIQLLEESLARVMEDMDKMQLEDVVEFTLEEGDPQEQTSPLDPAANSGRRKRSPETIRKPSRYMRRPVPVYNKAYGLDLKDGEGLQLYSSLQGPLAENSVTTAQPNKQPDSNGRRPLPPSFLKNGPILRRRPQTKDTPGDDVWDTAVSKVQQGSQAAPASLLQQQPLVITQQSRLHKRPRKKNNRRRRRTGRITAAHFNGLPAAAGSRSGMWEGSEWMEGLGLMSRYKTGGDHVMVADSGIYLVYAQALYVSGHPKGFSVKVNGKSEATCVQPMSTTEPATCQSVVVTYLPKNSVVRVERTSVMGSPVLSLGDGEQATLGLIKLLDAPDTYHELFTN